MIDLLRYSFQFVLLVLLQVLVLNNIQFMGYLNPYLYLIFILLLPAGTNKNLILVIGFALGFCIDIFENSGGLHASATVLLAFVRPLLFKLAAGPANLEIERFNIKTLGTARFMVLAAIAVFFHHIWLFSLEAFSFNQIFEVLKRTFISSVFTLLLIYISQLLAFRKVQ